MIKPKRISFDNYLKWFYDKLKLNSPTNEKITEFTPIFYKIDNQLNIFIISFNYLGFFIEVPVSLTRLINEHSDHFSNSLDEQQVPDPLDWINSKYMDSRGIEEL